MAKQSSTPPLNEITLYQSIIYSNKTWLDTHKCERFRQETPLDCAMGVEVINLLAAATGQAEGGSRHTCLRRCYHIFSFDLNSREKYVNYSSGSPKRSNNGVGLTFALGRAFSFCRKKSYYGSKCCDIHFLLSR